MEGIIIQEEIQVNQEFIDEVIEEYKQQSKKFGICIGEFSGNKDDIIREIKMLSEVGKQILLMKYKFKKWQKSLSTRSSGKSKHKRASAKALRKKTYHPTR